MTSKFAGLNLFDYSIWYELCSQMKRDKIKNKKILIDQIRTSVRKIRTEVVHRSVKSWTNRIYRMLRKRCEYIF